MIQTISNEKITWIDIINPTPDDLNNLRKTYNFHDLDLEDCLSKVQRPKFEEHDEYKFIVLHFPTFMNKNYKLVMEELDIFWGVNYLVTIHSSRMTKLIDMFSYIKNTETKFNKYFSQGSDYLLYKILHKMVLQIFPIMTQISHDIDWIDSNYGSIKPAKVIEKISSLRRNIIFLQTILKPQKNIFFVFENNRDQEEKEMDVYWGDIGDYLGKLIDMAEDYQELIEGLYSSIDTLLTFRTNNIMKLLTMISVIMLPLTFITSYYGMNIRLPFADSSYATGIITGTMIAASISIAIFFKISRF